MSALISAAEEAALKEEVNRCNQCGFCLAVCPTYQVTGNETMVARGRIAAVSEALAGRLGWAEAAVSFDTCLLCRACTEVCPPGVATDFVVTRAKAIAHRTVPRAIPTFIWRGLLGQPQRLRAGVFAAALAERAGLRKLAVRRRWLRRWPWLETAARVGPPLGGQSGYRLARRQAKAGTGGSKSSRTGAKPAPRARVAYFVGCIRDAAYPNAAEASVRVLQANGVEVVTPPNVCCGLMSHSQGDLAAARALARANLQVFGGLDVDAIILDEASCLAHFRHDIPRLFAGEPDEPQMRALAGKFRDLAEFLDELGMRPPGRLPLTVTWHDSCHLQNYLHATAAPRRILRQIPGLRLVEQVGAPACCGGAGTFMLTHPDLSDAILAQKMAAVDATGADVIVTSSPSCMMQLSRGVRAKPDGSPGPHQVMYLAELLDLAYKAL